VSAPDERFPAELEVAAWYVCAEAVANAAKHAGTATVAIEVRRDGQSLTVTITDDGPGGADPARGTGLRGLADRVEALGGRLVVESAEGSGTRLAAELPLPG
jgi:signal transduction histidine kinase